MFGSTSEPATWGARLLLALLLGAAGLLFVRGLTADLPSSRGWRLDEARPADLVNGRREWPARYPPLHRDVLVATFAAARTLAPATFAVRGAERWQLWLLGRGLTVAMALATLLLLWRVARRFVPAGPALLAPLAWALAPPVGYLARTMNLDIPYSFWFAASLWAWLELLERRTLGWAAAFAALGAAAILTKDQAAALYLLPAAWWLGVLYRDARVASGPARAALRALLDRRVVVPALLLLGLGALEYRLWHGTRRLEAHVTQLLGQGSDPYQLVPDGAVGQLDLLSLTARNAQLATGAVTLLAALAGIAVASAYTAVDPARRRVLTLLLFPASYYLGFLAPIGYVYDRFLIPVVLVLALFVPMALAHFSSRRTQSLAAALVASCLLAFDGRSALEVSQRAANESRNELTRLLAAPAFQRGNPVALGRSKLLPRGVEVWEKMPPGDFCTALAERDWLVFEHEWSSRHLILVRWWLRDGALGYRPVATFGGDPFETLDFTQAPGSNLQKLDLEVVLYRKSGVCGPPSDTE